ncbi:MAG: hypothetical protein L0Y74_10640, partial [candidate division Zixibacteria bacterium]|nr:hypothetical protein [candidate division Zixibacteria bacterium]
ICISLPKVMTLTAGRRGKIKRRLAEIPDLTVWETICRKVQANDFLTGKWDGGRPGWRASLDWLTNNDTNPVKVLEGTYDRNQTKADKYSDRK